METPTIKISIQGVLTSAFCSFLKEHFGSKSSSPARGWILWYHCSMCEPGSLQMTPDKRVRSRNTTDTPQALQGIQAPSRTRNSSKKTPLPTYSLVTESLAPAHESCHRVALMLMLTLFYRQFISVNKSKNAYSQEITQVQWQKTKRYSPGWQNTYPPSNRLNLSLHLLLCFTSICKGGYSPHSRIFANLPLLPRIIFHMTRKRLSEKSWAK